MAKRYLKVVFVGLVALMCLFYGTQNVVNLDACYQAFAYVLGAVDHQVYTNQVIPAIQSSTVIWLALITVVGLEFAAGLCAAKGAWDLWAARKASTQEFNNSKDVCSCWLRLGNRCVARAIRRIRWCPFYHVANRHRQGLTRKCVSILR